MPALSRSFLCVIVRSANHQVIIGIAMLRNHVGGVLPLATQSAITAAKMIVTAGLGSVLIKLAKPSFMLPP